MNIKMRDIGETVWVMDDSQPKELDIIGISLNVKRGTIREYPLVDGKTVSITKRYNEDDPIDYDVLYSLGFADQGGDENRFIIMRYGCMVFSSKEELIASL